MYKPKPSCVQNYVLCKIRLEGGTGMVLKYPRSTAESSDEMSNRVKMLAEQRVISGLWLWWSFTVKERIEMDSAFWYNHLVYSDLKGSLRT